MLPIFMNPTALSGWELAGESTLTAAAASITIPVLPVYRALWVEGFVVNDGNTKNVLLRINGDDGSNQYNTQRISATSTTVAGARVAATNININNGIALAASEHSSFSLLIVKPTASVKAQIINQHGLNASPVLYLNGAEWLNTSDLISSITILTSGNNFAALTTVRVFGHKAFCA